MATPSDKPLTHEHMATMAMLLARGCEDEHLERAIEWLGFQTIPETIAGVLGKLDEAIAVARSWDG